MSFFLCLWRPSGRAVNATMREEFARRVPEHVAGSVRWVGEGALWACLPENAAGGAVDFISAKAGVCVGDVRLDHRRELVDALRVSPVDAADHDLILEWVGCRGAEGVRDIIGDFAFVVWSSARRELVMGRDAFGVKTLAYRETTDLVAVSTHASCLDGREAYDQEYLADFLIGAGPSARTVFAGVSAVPPGCHRVYRRGSGVTRRYWTPREFSLDGALLDDDACRIFHDRFRRAVRDRAGECGTWAQLSGGLDSSSVVVMATELARLGEIRAGLSGVVTFVDTKGGDERPYAESVIRGCGVAAHDVTDFWLWQDDGEPAPRTDEPTAAYPFFARDRRFVRTVRDGGGRVLLSGQGSDHYIAGSLAFVTDLVAVGRVRDAVRELASRAVSGRRSFWRLAFEHVVEPFLPGAVRARVTQGWNPPAYMDRRFATRFDVTGRMPARAAALWPRGTRFRNEIAGFVDAMSIGLDRGVIGDALDVRYPFLYRPLVEFCLRLPAALRIRDGARKWIQREALRGLLPEMVRTRRSKGIIDGRIEWSPERERPRLDAMLRDSVLGDLGCVDVAAMRRAVDEARRGNMLGSGDVVNALALETWLQVRAGRWLVGCPADGRLTRDAAGERQMVQRGPRR